MFVAAPPLQLIPGITSEAHALLSDLHIGASSTDYKKLESDLHAAARHGAYLHINGDIFDAILPKDLKRYDPRALHPRLHGRADVLNAALDWAVELLAPHAPRIHEIGAGNHETAVEKHHACDMTALLVDRLRPHGLPAWVEPGGYCGFYQRKVCAKGTRKYWSWDMYRSHGAGGAAPVTKGVIDFARMREWVTARVVWIGHKHNRLIVPGLRIYCNDQGRPVQECVYNVMTGAYLDTYGVEPGTSPSYASQWNIAPQPTGGWLMRVKYGKKQGVYMPLISFEELS